MNIIHCNQAGGFPLTTETLNFIQNTYKIFNAISGLTGDLAIVSGCQQVGNTISDGVVCIEGELYPFEGNTIGTTVFIKETPTPQTFEDGSSKNVYIQKVATFGNSTRTYPWASFKRIMTNQQIEQQTLSDDNSVLKRLEKLENRVTKTIPIGLVAIWGKPANVPIPEGWREYEPLRGKMPIGHHTSDADFGSIGAEGGEKTHTLTSSEMPSHRHSYEDSIAIADMSAGEAEWFKNRGNNIDGYTHTGQNLPGSADNNNYMRFWKNRTSSATGGDQPHNNMPPYRVIQFIEFVGF